jgi:Asp-tRNA(Asn)/Glu-tRNA(Gln) amidotransferase A subunit family amidase
MLVPPLLSLLQDSAPSKETAPFGPLEIGIAADVNGLHFSEKELELMLPDVLERLQEFERLRAVPLANDVVPALYFLPAPEAARRGPEKPNLEAIGGPPPKRPPDLEDLVYEPIWVLHEMLESKAVSCEELTRTYIARLKRLDTALHCVVTLTEERALAQARERDRELAEGKPRGILHGLPWVAKDLLAVKDYPTTWGTPPFRDQQLDHDAAVVERLDAAGAVLIAKVSLGELAMGDVWFGGKTRNPWKPEQGSSGSSAGTASAVSAGCAVFGIGSETLGSIVSPSTVCGNSALRPTFGQVSRFGAMTLSWSMDKLGPFAHSAEDAGLVFAAIHGHDPRDPTTVDVPFAPRAGPHAAPDLHGWKVGVPKGAFEGDGARCKAVLEELEKLGVELVDIELPKYPVSEMLLVLTAEAGAAFDDFSRGDEDGQMVRQTRDAWPNTFRQAALIPAVDYIRANRLRTLLIRDLEATLSGVRAIVHPSFAGSLLSMTNLSGHPTFVAPCGFAADGTPYSVSFTGKLYGDADVLALAMAWQAATDYHRRHPKL